MSSVALIGDEGLLTLCGNHLQEQGWSISAVMTSAQSVREWAQSNSIVVVAEFDELASTKSPDYLFSITNFRIVPKAVIAWARLDAFNFHDGPLPEVAGLNTPSWAILRHADSHAVSWHRLTSEVDGGDLFVRKDFSVQPEDTALELNARCFELGFAGFEELIAGLSGGDLKPQSPAVPLSYFGRADKPPYLGFVDWRASTADVLALFRATAYAGYRNGLSSCKVLLPAGYLLPTMLSAVDHADSAAPGTVLASADRHFDVCTADGVVRVEAEHSRALPLAGQLLPAIDRVFPADDFADHDYGCQHDDMVWPAKLEHLQLQGLAQLPLAAADPVALHRLEGVSELGPTPAKLLAALSLVVGRMNDASAPSVAVSTARLRRVSTALHGALLAHVPVTLTVDNVGQALIESAESALNSLSESVPIPVDLFARIPVLADRKSEFSSAHTILHLVDADDALAQVAEHGAQVVEHGAQVALLFDATDASVHVRAAVSNASAGSLDRWLLTALALLDSDQPLLAQPLIDATDRKLLVELNEATRSAYPSSSIHQLLRRRAEQTPDQTALAFRGVSCSYAELVTRADAVTLCLRERGYADDALVGVMLTDRIQTVVTMLGILQADLAYVPLDPSYPTERLRYIANDAGLACVLADAASAASHELGIETIDPQSLTAATQVEPASLPDDPTRRAYVIYTSGSTGKPKGVQVTHDNVINFLHGMDQVIDKHDGTMLSVTSISFDISVLEIWWSLTRGLNVVFYDEQDTLGASSPTIDATGATDSIAFSLYFWNTQDPAAPSTVAETYDLLRQAVTFADQHGFEAIWSPERHFGSFGGPFPNPAITSAALATITERVKIRAGSCVMPLHHPIRVAEDWAMIDNLSNGRVGISFASGWMPRDFVLAPENHAESKQVMFDGIDKVRALWRGEEVTFPSPTGEEQIRTLPRPVQPELPCWLTTAGSPDTFAQAGKLGLNVLTHLLGQSVDELGEKLQAYRQARRDAGHAGPGSVTLMLHTFVTTDKEHAREVARGPMKAYLRSAMGLVKAAAWEFPTFKKMSAEEKQDMDGFFANLTEEDLDDLLEFAFQRYFKESGLFGAPQDNLALLERLKSIGVNEIGCLIDFGIQPKDVLEHLPYLDELRSLSSNMASNSLAEIVQRCSVTHLQCTPSQAAMFKLNDDLDGLSALDCLLVGGEALSQSLADDLSPKIAGQMTNMYGPTETTVWSLTSPVRPEEPVRIGRPIANTSIHVLDRQRREVPNGWAGELYIGGSGVSLGYLDRPELNAERFVDHDGQRIYATGDLVRISADGNVEFLGRHDHQVKIRGYRIELGEIESALTEHAQINEAVVMGEADQWGETQLVTYFTGASSVVVTELREHLAKFLPAFMVPSKFHQINAMPRTLNDKVDRKALKQAERSNAGKATAASKPLGKPLAPASSEVQQQLMEIWQGLLELDVIDVNANFFDLGGHSILAVRMQGMLSKQFGRRVPISELFRYPTVAGLASYLDSATSGDAKPAKDFGKDVASRAARRRARFQDR